MVNATGSGVDTGGGTCHDSGLFTGCESLGSASSGVGIDVGTGVGVSHTDAHPLTA